MSPPRSDSSRPTDPPGDRPRSTAWAENVGSMYMSRPQIVMNAPAGDALSFNVNLNSSASRPSPIEATVESVVITGADHEIYYQQLLTKRRGSPLWVPGPGMQLPIEYRRQGICIGDVGIITSTGTFDFLFNLFLPANHPINNGNVPQSFSPLQFEREIQKTRDYGPNTSLTSSSVRNAAVRRTGRSWFGQVPPQTFESTSGEAAILTMPHGASTQNLLNTLQIRQCISENAQNWYDYAIQVRGRLVGNGDIRVVVGFDKVKSWGIATSTCNAGQTASLTFRLDRHLNRTRYCWECTGGSGRVGPDEVEISDLIQNNKIPENQCVFVRTMNFTVSGHIGYDFPSQAVAQPLSSAGEPGEGDSVSANRGRTEGRTTSGGAGASSSFQSPITFDPVRHGIHYHPSAALHAYLSEKFPDASVVITEDSDWISVLNDEDAVFPQPEDLVERVLKSGNPSERDGIVTIRMDPLQLPSLVTRLQT